MSPQALLERLTDRFVLSADGMRAVSVRQKTLNNAIGWSYHSLPIEEQKLFSYLSVFSGGFTVEAAEAIFSDGKVDRPVADLVNSLADKSLLQRSFDAYDDIRYNMLVTVQHFAMDRLVRSGDDLSAHDAHLAYFMRFAEQGDRDIHGPSQAEWMDRMEREHENFRVALDWGISNQRTEAALRLLGALGWLWEVRGHFSEARKWFDKILSLPDIDKYPAVYANLLNHEGRHCWAQKNYRDAHAFLEQGHALALKLGPAGERLLADNVNWIGLLTHFDERDDNKARDLFQQGLEIYRKWDDKRGQVLATFHLGIAESGLNHADTALSLYEHSLSLFRQLGDLFFIARVSEFLRYIFYKRGDYEKVRMYLDQHLEIDRKLRYWEGIADALHVLGDLHHQQGKLDEAERCEQESLSIRREHGLL
jgi:tetratricopeptide (TPR) repeat protein